PRFTAGEVRSLGVPLIPFRSSHSRSFAMDGHRGRHYRLVASAAHLSIPAVASLTALAPKTALITATASAPASIASLALAARIPPIATTGLPNRLASRSNSSAADTARGLVLEGK